MTEVSIITGAAGLLGEQHALALASEGYNLLLTDIEKTFQNAVKNKKKFKKNKILVFPMDITNEDEIIEMKKFVKKD